MMDSGMHNIKRGSCYFTFKSWIRTGGKNLRVNTDAFSSQFDTLKINTRVVAFKHMTEIMIISFEARLKQDVRPPHGNLETEVSRLRSHTSIKALLKDL
jgi:hypothetical protein